MDINDDDNEGSHCSREGLYIEQNSYTPETLQYYTGHSFTEDDGIDERTLQGGAKHKILNKVKKKVIGKNKELRFKCQQCEYRTWKKSNYERHLGTHKKKPYRCTLCPFSGKHADDLQQHIICHRNKESSEPINVNHFDIVEKLIKNEQSFRIKANKEAALSISKVLKFEPKTVKIKEESSSSNPPVEVYVDEQSSNSGVAESSSIGDYDSDNIPHSSDVGSDAPSQSKENALTITPVNSSSIPIGRPSTTNIEKEVRFRCPYCPYRTWKTSNFQRHLCTHNTERPYKCNLCQYSGKHHEDLKKHMICHKNAGTILIANNETAIIPIVPNNNENELIKKALMNNNTKRFTCLLCDFETTRSSALNRHQFVVHNDNRPYACDLCPYRSKLRDSLKKHMMSHTDERPFECEICHHRCRQKGDLKRHRLLHTGERPFACPHCPYRSNRTQLLKKHISRRHSIPHISSEITVTKTTTGLEEFGSHYLANIL
ncbi:hypothetical protein O3M35_007762 [Rhynocoris fuscipes]|uniref:C2H2-type domain-containing protein n=1 Tax=Rhynocoris fuscipes TaxID=488301 RepID=A0AAW1DAF6_9HEMI